MYCTWSIFKATISFCLTTPDIVRWLAKTCQTYWLVSLLCTICSPFASLGIGSAYFSLSHTPPEVSRCWTVLFAGRGTTPLSIPPLSPWLTVYILYHKGYGNSVFVKNPGKHLWNRALLICFCFVSWNLCLPPPPPITYNYTIEWRLVLLSLQNCHELRCLRPFGDIPLSSCLFVVCCSSIFSLKHSGTRSFSVRTY